ncbi:MAG: hypothetical protein R3Y28_08375 [Candidatus Gastranaerophilales bacterium]
MDFKDGALFDPGFIQHMHAFVPTIENVYGTLDRYKNFSQKKMQFKMYYPNIQKLIKNYMGFYVGCLLWAVYIKKFDDKPIINNLCYGAEYLEEEALYEITFFEAYLKQLAKDAKYYLAQVYEVDAKTIGLIELYKEFMIENKGFSATLNTSDLVLPKSIKTPNSLGYESILKKIEEVILTGKLEELVSLTDLII